MKFLILVAFAILGVACADLTPWIPVPVDDKIANQALDARKPQIILDLIKKYPNITHNPIFGVNSVEKQISGNAIYPPFVYYRFNVTLSVLKADPLNSKFIGTYTPIVTFNVTLLTQNYQSHVEVVADPEYSGIVVHSLPETLPLPDQDNDFPTGDIFDVNLPINDTGLWIAISALQDKIWQKLEEKNIKRPNATSAPKDDFAPSSNYSHYFFSRNKTTGNLYSSYDISLYVLNTPLSTLLKPKKPIEIWVTLLVQHKAAVETFDLQHFDFTGSFDEDYAPLLKLDLLKLDLVSAGPSKDDHDCNHYLGNPEPVDSKSKQLWTVFNALKKDVLKLLRELNFRVNFPDDSIFDFNDGQVQYKDNHGDLDKPIVRKITANFTVKKRRGSGPVTHFLPLKTILKTKVVLQESINPSNATSSYKLLQVDNCKVDGPCAVPL